MGSMFGLFAFSVLCCVGRVVFRLFCYLIRAGARFLCVQFVFCCCLVWFWTHWRTARTVAVCRFCAQDPAASEVNAIGLTKLCQLRSKTCLFYKLSLKYLICLNEKE